MTAKEFLKTIFGAFIGGSEMSITPVMPFVRDIKEVNEYELEFGTRADTFYALDAFSLCPRAYMLKHLAMRPLSIPFYAQVVDCVRETIMDYVNNEIQKEKMGTRFRALLKERAVGPFPIHYPDKNWVKDYENDIGVAFDNFSPWWEEDGWDAVDVCVPVSNGDSNLVGTIDLLLKKDGKYAIAAYDLGSCVYIQNNGRVAQDLEGQELIKRLKRKLYLYGDALKKERGIVVTDLFLYLVKPKSRKLPVVLTYKWDQDEFNEVLAWSKKIINQISYSKESRQWPAAVVYSSRKDGTLVPDKNFCHQRCVHCVSCRWAGWHPEEISEFADGDKIIQLPPKYFGMKLKLKPELKLDQEILMYQGNITIENGSVKSISSAKSVINNMGIVKIGDLNGKSVFDIASVQGCGIVKLETIIGLFFDAEV